jgi:hypothetical protein
MAKTEYKVLKGIDYPPNKRAEIGAIVSDLPKESISWLLASGVITDDLKVEVPAEVVAKPVEAIVETAVIVDELDEVILEEDAVGEDNAV